MRSAVPAGTLRILIALLRVYETTGRATVRGVAAEAGRSISTTHFHLERLADEGFAVWDLGTKGTLRPLLRPATFRQKSHARS